jgi:hypothetical protein
LGKRRRTSALDLKLALALKSALLVSSAMLALNPAPTLGGTTTSSVIGKAISEATFGASSVLVAELVESV